MADFYKAYKRTAKFEGGYANNKNDRGGETYAGIARKFWPRWEGWAIIDAIKKDHGRTAAIINKYAAQDPKLQVMKQNFYKINFWNDLQLSIVNDQQLAENVYDFGVNAGTFTAARNLQQAANALGAKLVVDGKIGAKTITALNSLDGASLYNEFNEERRGHYDAIIANDETQAEFRKSWYSRITPYQS